MRLWHLPVIMLAVATGGAACTQKSKLTAKKKTGTISVASTSGSTILTITNVQTIVSGNNSMIEILGSQFDSWCQAAAGSSAAPSTCTVEILDQDAGGGSATTTRETEQVEPNLIRVMAVPGLSPSATVRIYVSQVDGYSNTLPLSGTAGITATNDLRRYTRVMMYHAVFIHTPINPMTGLVDPIEREAHDDQYTLYTTNPGRTKLLIGFLSNSQSSPMQRFRFSFEPTYADSFMPMNPADRYSGAKWKNLVFGSGAMQFACEDLDGPCPNPTATSDPAFNSALMRYEWEPGAATQGLFASGTQGSPKRKTDFWLSRSRGGPFQTPVHAMVAPDVPSFAPPAQAQAAGLVDPLGFAARPDPVTGACPSTQLPNGFIWAKIFPACAMLPSKSGIQDTGAYAPGTDMRVRSDIVCNPGPWDSRAEPTPNPTTAANPNLNFLPDCANQTALGCPLGNWGNSIGALTSPETIGSGLPAGESYGNYCHGYAARIFGDQANSRQSGCFRSQFLMGETVNQDLWFRIYGAVQGTPVPSPPVTVRQTIWSMDNPNPPAVISPNTAREAFESTNPTVGPLDNRTDHKDCLFVVVPASMSQSEIYSATGQVGSTQCEVGNGEYCPVRHRFISRYGVPTGKRFSVTYVPQRQQVGDDQNGLGVYPLCAPVRRVD